MIYYVLLFIATLLYALSFYFNKIVEHNCKETSDTTVLFLAVTWAEILSVLLILLGGKLQITPFSLVCAFVHSVCLVVYTVLNLKILKTVSLATYSLFTMLGGMLVPTFYGIIFACEPVTFGKIMCWILVTASLVFDAGKLGAKLKETLLLIGVFFINGFFGVISAIHQNGEYSHVGTLEYMSIEAILISSFCVIWLCGKLVKSKKLNAAKNKKAYLGMLGYGLLYGGAELILLVAIVHIPSSVQFPVITGGTILFSTALGALAGENMSVKSLISTVIAVAGLMFLFV